MYYKYEKLSFGIILSLGTVLRKMVIVSAIAENSRVNKFFVSMMKISSDYNSFTFRKRFINCKEKSVILENI